MALKFRRGTTAQKSGSLAFGEPYVNTTLGTLQIGLDTGDITLSATGTGSNLVVGGISGSQLDITGNAKIDGNITVGGNIQIGDQNADTVNIVATISSSLIPSADNTFDVGSGAKRYANVYANTISASTFSNMGAGNFSNLAYYTASNKLAGFGNSYISTNTLGLGTPNVSAQAERLMVESQTINLATFQTSLQDTYGQLNIKNFGSGSNASADLVIWNDVSTENSNYIDLGLNSSNYSAGGIGYGGDGYLYSYANDMYIGSALSGSHGHVHLFGGGLWTSSSISIYSDGTIGINTDKLNNSASTIPTAGYAMEISGAVKFNNNINVSGVITGQIGATNGVVSGSAQIVGILSSLNAFSASNDNTSLNAFTASNNISSLNVYTASQDTKNATLSLYTSSLETKNSTLASVTASLLSSQTNLNTYTASQDVKNSTLATYTASLETKNATLGTYTSSLETKNSTLASVTASLLSSQTNLNAYTGSLLNAFQITGSRINFQGDVVIYGTQSVINSQNVEIADNILYLAPTASIDNDLGIVGHYNDGTYKHGGVFMDASDGHAWKVFNGLTGETSATIDTAAPSFTLADFKAGAFTGTSFTGIHNGTINSTNGVVSGSSQIDATATTNWATGIKTQLNTNTVVSGSSQIDHNLTTNYVANRHIDHTAVSITAGNGISGGGDISATRTITLDTGSAHFIAGARATNSAGSGITYSALGVIAASGITTSNLSATAGILNSQLASSTISGVSLGSNLNTLTIGTGLSGTSYNGSAAVTIANTGVLSITSNTGLSSNVSATGNVTITNTGVTSNVAGTGISVSGATGAVTITNTGVTSAVAGTGVSVSGATGAVTFSIGQAVATTSAVTFASVTATGDIVAYSTSDKRHKNNITLIENALEKVTKLNGVTWEWNDDVDDVTKLSPKTGLIAQEVQEVLPEVVTERENGFLGLDYSKMMGLMVEAIKEQQIQIHNLTLQLEEVKKQKGL